MNGFEASTEVAIALGNPAAVIVEKRMLTSVDIVDTFGRGRAPRAPAEPPHPPIVAKSYEFDLENALAIRDNYIPTQ